MHSAVILALSILRNGRSHVHMSMHKPTRTQTALAITQHRAEALSDILYKTTWDTVQGHCTERETTIGVWDGGSRRLVPIKATFSPIPLSDGTHHDPSAWAEVPEHADDAAPRRRSAELLRQKSLHRRQPRETPDVAPPADAGSPVPPSPTSSSPSSRQATQSQAATKGSATGLFVQFGMTLRSTWLPLLPKVRLPAGSIALLHEPARHRISSASRRPVTGSAQRPLQRAHGKEAASPWRHDFCHSVQGLLDRCEPTGTYNRPDRVVSGCSQQLYLED